MFNNVGYELADGNKKLPIALEYAEKAVGQEEEASQKLKLSELGIEDLAHTSSLAAFWDTLGWVHFRMGNLDQGREIPEVRVGALARLGRGRPSRTALRTSA
jgi:hypothetical protein